MLEIDNLTSCNAAKIAKQLIKNSNIFVCVFFINDEIFVANLLLQARLVQANLEDNFFNNQPASVKTTIDFLSERLASNIRKLIRYWI